MSFNAISLKNIKGVLIDLDNTLYAYEPAHQKAITACFEKYVEHVSSFETFTTRYRFHRTEVTKKLSPQGACRSRLLAFQALCEELNLTPSYYHALILANCYWDTFIEHMTIFPEAKAFLKKCKENQIPVCVVTDMLAETQIKKIMKLELEPYITYLVSSEEAGTEKPHASIFNLALKKLNCQAKHAIMIGDHPIKDINGAKELGIQTQLIEIPPSEK